MSDLIGERPGFEHLPQELQPEVIEEHVLDLLDESAGTLEWIDCSESPCIAVLSVPDFEMATLRAAADPIRDGLATDYPWEAFGVQAELKSLLDKQKLLGPALCPTTPGCTGCRGTTPSSRSSSCGRA